MPSGYTCGVQDGKITTLQDYAMGCARNFGACIMMRDDPSDTPIPDEFESSQYHNDALAEDEKELERMEILSITQADTLCETEYQKRLDRWKEEKKEENTHLTRYRSMLTKAEQYVPPTSEHESFAKFMVSQLIDSIKWDCGYELKEPKLQNSRVWLGDRIKELQKSIYRHKHEQKEEDERTAKRNKWIADLRESLKEHDDEKN